MPQILRILFRLVLTGGIFTGAFWSVTRPLNHYRLGQDFDPMRAYTALAEGEVPISKHPLLQIKDREYPDYYRAAGNERAYLALTKLSAWQSGHLDPSPPPEFSTLIEKYALADMVLRRRKIDCTRLACISLTFDDGPSIYTPGIIDVLGEYDAKATFYVLGQLIRHQPETLIRMHKEGHEIANHTWSHPNLRQASNERIVAEITRSTAEIEKYTGTTPTNMRPPYGSYDSRVSQMVDLPLIMWSVDTSDWQHRDTYQTITRATHWKRAILFYSTTFTNRPPKPYPKSSGALRKKDSC